MADLGTFSTILTNEQVPTGDLVISQVPILASTVLSSEQVPTADLLVDEVVFEATAIGVCPSSGITPPPPSGGTQSAMFWSS